MQDFMKGRYGVDDLSGALGAVGVVLTLIGTIADERAISIVALVVIVIALLRAFSRDSAARSRENDAFHSFARKIPIVGERFGAPPRSGSRASKAGTPSADELKRQARKAKKMWKERKTKAFIKCPTCGTMLSVPKGKGKIIVTCPKCHSRMETRS